MASESGPEQSSGLTEDRIVREIFLKEPPLSSDFVVPPGDDAAVVRVEGDLVATADILVEGVHFDLSYFSPEDLGYRAVAVNLSDLAAMGARPHSCLVSVGMPSLVSEEFVRGLAAGIRDSLEEFGASLAGGDTVRSERVVVSVTALGTLDGKPLTRSGAKEGDGIYISGPAGLSHIGMLFLTGGTSGGEDLEEARRKHLRPVPRVALGLALREREIASSCIDTSDGLVRDLTRILEASGVGASIDVAPLLDERLRKLAQAAGVDPLDALLYGGEDFELLFTVPPEKEKELLRSVGEEVIRIGIVRAERGLSDSLGGEPLSLSGKGKSSFEHFGEGGA
ncbi:MAG: thiamine-phosphate kinase [Deltaproteobacteria bacterium]|nr:MAG: thiamine-phosphate kinase [Deltaproteobacteria bacterium]